MAWKVWGEWISTAEGTSTTIFQPVIPDTNLILKACRAWLVVYNDPAFTDIAMRIYSDDAGVPGRLLHTSTSVTTKAQLITDTNGIKETFFEFLPSGSAGIPLRGGTTYHFVLYITGYTGTDATHLAWKKSWPDPAYTTNVTTTWVSQATNPYNLTFIGADI